MDSKEYHRQYNLQRYYHKKALLISAMGGKCVICESVHNLQFDHVVPSTKSYSITVKLLSYPWEEILKESEKCQLLCEACHITKTIMDTGKKSAVGTHGTISSYRYCKCNLCRKAKSDYSKARRSASVATGRLL